MTSPAPTMCLLPADAEPQQQLSGIAPIVLGPTLAAKQTMYNLPQDEDSLLSTVAGAGAGEELEDSSPALQRALAQARAKRGPVLLIPRASPDSEAEEEEEEPELANDSLTSSSSESESDSDVEKEKGQDQVPRRPFSLLRSVAASAPANVLSFPTCVTGDTSDEDDNCDDAPVRGDLGCPQLSNRSSTDLVAAYSSIVVRDDSEIRTRKTAASSSRREPSSCTVPSSPRRSSTYLTRKEAAIQWIKSQLVISTDAPSDAAVRVDNKEGKTVKFEEPTKAGEGDASKMLQEKIIDQRASARRKLLSSLSADEQKKALESRSYAERPSLSERRASSGRSTRKVPTLGQISSHVSAVGNTLKAAASPPSVARIASSPGTPSLGWASAIRNMPIPTPRSPFVAKCGGIEIRITPPSPRPVGFTPKIPGVTLRHSFAPPPGSVRYVSGAAKLFANGEALTPPPFDVAPGRNIILQRRAEDQMRQLKELAERQMQAQNTMSFEATDQAAANVKLAVSAAQAITNRRSGSSSPSSTSIASPKPIPDSPLPPRAGASLAEALKRNKAHRAATLQMAISSPVPTQRSQPIYIPPGANGHRSGQLKRETGLQVPQSATVRRERTEAGRNMLSRLGQRSAVPPQSAF